MVYRDTLIIVYILHFQEESTIPRVENNIQPNNPHKIARTEDKN